LRTTSRSFNESRRWARWARRFAHLAIGAESLYVHSGAVLFHAGGRGWRVRAPGGSFSLATGQSDREPVVVGPGTLLGELALFTETSRPVTATALEPSTVMRIPRSLFLKMLEGFPVTARKLRDALALRNDQTTRDISNVRTALGDSGPD
jgi:CRP-like cAMP-binding protein